MSERLNLARALRSKTFDEIIGQELAVRLVKNSLYKDHLFPAYLLAGQRGCGKTTLARVFAAALNCASLAAFRERPREVQVPCLACLSCQSMTRGDHPDFIEIDAASHTGVDNVRSLIESASFLPVAGRKKIYLIDEAHMLSKAAFNAFLKVLEEPPRSVVFMLATTDPHKIIETVRSRCFQLFIDPVRPAILAAYLETVCAREEIPYEPEAIYAIAQESEGSVRDALNRIEQVRLAFGRIHRDELARLKGEIAYEEIIALIDAAMTKDTAALLHVIHNVSLSDYNPLVTFKRGVEILKHIIHLTYSICDPQIERFKDELSAISSVCDVRFSIKALELWYRVEPLIVKSKAQHTMIEMILLQIAELRSHASQRHEGIVPSPTQKKTSATSHLMVTSPVMTPPVAMSPVTLSDVAMSPVVSAPMSKQVSPEAHTIAVSTQTSAVQDVPEAHHTTARETSELSVSITPADVPYEAEKAPWQLFLAEIKAKDDPLMYSIFRQARFIGHTTEGVEVAFGKHVTFFNDLIEQTRPMWQPVLEKIFGTIRLQSQFNEPAKKPSTGTVMPASQEPHLFTAGDQKSPSQSIERHEASDRSARPVVTTQSAPSTFRASPQPAWNNRRVPPPRKAPLVDVRDKEKWSRVHAVLNVFPGTVREHAREELRSTPQQEQHGTPVAPADSSFPVFEMIPTSIPELMSSPELV